MRQPTKRRFDTSSDNRHSRKCFAGPMAIRQSGTVRSQPNPASGGIGIIVTYFPIGGVVVDQRIHVARADAEKQSWPAKLAPRFARAPIGLAQNGHSKPGCFEDSAQNR